ncbi:GNAT family N-acetyltransferase [Virgibacillus siamensis]|uniref:GNAT family N-acetyltransferase n=1 Tax=Virgibacillus siamensis TaxID=480071 RepID=UPI000987BF3E|nr:GNAT family N-acetyltransferase [Virgibacillus siamensis]
MRIQRLKTTENPPMELLLTADPSENNVREYLSKGQCYVVRKDNVVIGVYVLTQERQNKMELVNVAVLEHYQGQGIGTKMIQHAIANAQLQGYQFIDVGTGNSSIDQLRLYQQCGFRMVKIRRDYFVENYNEPIYENGIQCRDMVRLSIPLRA